MTGPNWPTRVNIRRTSVRLSFVCFRSVSAAIPERFIATPLTMYGIDETNPFLKREFLMFNSLLNVVQLGIITDLMSNFRTSLRKLGICVRNRYPPFKKLIFLN